MLARITLSDARDAVGCSSYTDIDEIRAALKRYRIQLGRKVDASDWSTLRGRRVTALVATGYRKEKWQ
jgi:hypothetical protein